MVFRPDGWRITIPCTSISHVHRDETLPTIPPPIPTSRLWQTEGVFFASGGAAITCTDCGKTQARPGFTVQLDQLGAVSSWSRAKHHPLTNAEVRGRSVVLTKPRGGVVTVSFNSIGWILESPLAEPKQEWPVTEVTPADPRRHSTTKPKR